MDSPPTSPEQYLEKIGAAEFLATLVDRPIAVGPPVSEAPEATSEECGACEGGSCTISSVCGSSAQKEGSIYSM